MKHLLMFPMAWLVVGLALAEEPAPAGSGQSPQGGGKDAGGAQDQP